MSFSVQSCLQDFNSSVEKFQKLKTEATENLLNCSLSLVDSSKDLLEFSPNSIENCHFFINLHNLLECLEPKSDTTWTCISILQCAIKNQEAREAILNQFRFMPSLTKILSKIESPEKIKIILQFLQDLSYGIKITWEEPYLVNLLEILIRFIYDDENDLGKLSLSVLINLCYKNVVAIFLLLRMIRLTTFIKNISSYGILASKMQIILDSHANIPDVKYLHYFIKQSFLEMKECLNNWNLSYLRHIIDFLTDTENNDGMDMAMKEYKDFSTDIEKLIDHLNGEELQVIENTDDVTNKNQANCLNSIFELINHILQIDSSLQSITPQIFDLAVKWVNSKFVLTRALEMMKTILEQDENCKGFYASLNNILPELVQISESTDVTSEQLTAFFKLLLVLIKNKQITKNLVISIIKESYFDKQFSSLLNIKLELLNYETLNIYDLSRYLYCLMILIEFSNFAQDIWLKKILNVFKMKQIQFIIAKAVISGNEDLCNIVFQISKTEGFPIAYIAKKVTELSPYVRAENTVTNCDVNELSSSSSVTSLEQQKVAFSIRKLCDRGRFDINKETELRLDDLISNIFESKRKGELNNVATSELIELFNYKVNLFSNTEKNLCKRLEDSSVEITNLSHRISLLSKELIWYHNTNFKLNLTQEKLHADNADLLKQRDILKESVNVINKDFKTEQSKVEIYKRNLESNILENEGLRKELDMYRKRETSNLNEIKKQETTINELTTKIETLKKSIKLYDENKKENKKLLEDKEKENIKLQKIINDLRESNAKSENVIKHVQAQLAEKNEKIKTYEEELRETEELRNTILTLMKPKRKNNSQMN